MISLIDHDSRSMGLRISMGLRMVNMGLSWSIHGNMMVYMEIHALMRHSEYLKMGNIPNIRILEHLNI